ncbi:hypothetical protein [Halomonas sp. B23F22_10]|uniref:hypothetical protein n=1 Tax=Halomonas sp. B23F22_10 TaxID=3459515 RepID=UPI00373E5879
MGMRDDLQTDLAEAFDDDLADAVTAFSGSREIVGEYDPVTGTNAATVAYSGRGVLGSFRQEEVDGQHILATDQKLTALQNEVTLDEGGGLAEPQVDDTIAGLVVKNVGQDPVAATWTLALRKT